MNNIRLSAICILLVSILTACAPQAATLDVTPTPVPPTQTSIPPTATLTSTSFPTETPLPSSTPSPIPPTCAVPISPADNATIPARGPFDFTWMPFAGAASYVVSIGLAGWYPTNFPVTGTTLTRYMENFPNSPSYEWSISAVNATGGEICKAGPYKFVMSVDLYATPSFSTVNSVTSVTQVSQSENNSSNNSSGGQENGSNQNSSSNAYLDASFMIIADGDTQDCRLGVSYKVKINHEFTSFKLLYGLSQDALDNSVDFTAAILEPYPAYNNYNAVTPPLPVRNGDTVYFATWYALDIGTTERGPVFSHSMTNCNQ